MGKGHACACRCGETVYPSRTLVKNKMARWRKCILAKGRTIYFYSIACMAKFCESASSETKSTIRKNIAKSTGTMKGCSVKVELMHLEKKLQADQGEGAPSQAAAAAFFPKHHLRTLTLIMLTLLSELLVKAGRATFQSTLEKLQSLFPKKVLRGMKLKRRCLVYALFDPTSLWILVHYVQELEVAELLFNVVVAVVLLNHWSRLRRLMPKGLLPSTLSYHFLKEFGKFYDSSGIPRHTKRLGVAEGLCSNTKNAVNGALKACGLLEKSGENSQMLGMGFFLEHAGAACTDAWRKVRDGVDLISVLRDNVFCNRPASAPHWQTYRAEVRRQVQRSHVQICWRAVPLAAGHHAWPRRHGP